MQPGMQQGMQLIRVTGMDGAKAYQMPPNSVVPLFDADNDIMYVKSTDGAGFPTIRAFAFQPVEDKPEPVPQYVTRLMQYARGSHGCTSSATTSKSLPQMPRRWNRALLVN